MAGGYAGGYSGVGLGLGSAAEIKDLDVGSSLGGLSYGTGLGGFKGLNTDLKIKDDVSYGYGYATGLGPVGPLGPDR